MPIDMEKLKDLDVTLWDGSSARLGRFWKDCPLVLVFLRHYG
jgi:hypothetical protein